MTAVLVATCTTTTGLEHHLGNISCRPGGAPIQNRGVTGDQEKLLLRIRADTQQAQQDLLTGSPGLAMSQTRGRGKTSVTAKLPSSAAKENVVGRNGISGLAAKRKAIDYDEDVEGFQFTRAGNVKKPKQTNGVLLNGASDGSSTPELSSAASVLRQQKKKPVTSRKPNDIIEPSSESIDNRTMKPKSKRPVQDSTEPMNQKQSKSLKKIQTPDPGPIHVAKKRKPGSSKDSAPKITPKDNEEAIQSTPEEIRNASTKIALPFADTPVIQRNKDMRKEKSRKGQRRSSLSLRGRRASSLIDSGVSNASEGLPEPRRMRQLLTWCATRALGEKPTGSRSEDESARLAARVIQEELLKDFGDRSDLTDWFSRPETTTPAVVIKKPNPKNIQNADKIKELEEHIRRLQAERQSLAALIRPPSVPSIGTKSDIIKPPTSKPDDRPEPLRHDPPAINQSLLDPTQASILNILGHSESRTKEASSKTANSSPEIDTSILSILERLTRLSTSLTPALDSFATGIHNIEMFRQSADSLSSHILRICARRLEERDALQGKNADVLTLPGGKEDGKNSLQGTVVGGREDLSDILRALSRLERR
ncbi:Mis12-Mtw1 family protein [Trichophyton benhamiae CBS 112371]|uniref:Mis12-Mtw1 family protein n=1 Tax=Arthroderma benhamiae (strain ATCC MYA-4681 / CBS 112371) TaxID=663331 RepID=D4B3D4_ARTBC|nr:Mis12-Mtw1 family protein [Trichophyton benhamiae CBS 112371]EFE30180.1 Mis12-Mtw1 family protein [Trichophyton benhamiae CBS 112371]